MQRITLAASVWLIVSTPALALDKDTVQQQASRFAQSVNQGDMATVASMYTDGAYLMPPQTDMVRGRDNIQRFWSELARQASDLKLTTVNVERLGDEAAREIGAFTLTVKGQSPEYSLGKYVIVLRKVGEEWKIETKIWNTNQ